MAATGDWGCSSNTDQTVKSINNHGAPTTLGLGDNSYEDTPTCWYNKIKPIDGDANPSISKRVKITIGNHDDDPSSLLTSYINHFHLPKAYYSFDREYVHVIVMNTEDPNISSPYNSAQYNFIKSNLEQARANPNVKWIIVIGHKPFFTSPNGCSSKLMRRKSTSMTRTYQPLFDTNKVDMVFWGHVHNYQRTYPLKFNSNNPLSPTKTTSAKIEYNNPTGTIYAIVGTGGVNFHSLTGQASFVVAQQANKFGQLDLSFSDDGNTLFGKFCANDPNTADPCYLPLQMIWITSG